jgi:glycine/D-amino acid oxidase-like deaminating enzyme/nitrite reductase/ring-hydroxylating ferredoxin subunit
MPTTSYWFDTESTSRFPPLRQDISVDVVVIGAGSTGITAAYLLKKAGLTVALIERDRCARVNTGHTSAHLTYVTDLRPRKLLDQLGRDHAEAVWDAGQAAIERIEDTIRNEGIDCDFAHVPGFLHASLTGDGNEAEELQREADAANELGNDATYVDRVPIFKRPGVRFSNQARFHPVKYIAHLLKLIPGDGSHVFEHTEAEEFADDSLQVKANGHTLKSNFVIIATDVPLQGKTNLVSATLFQTKITPYTSYVIGGRVAKRGVPDALFWDTSDPYFYLRIDPRSDHDCVIFGGADHKTGQEADTDNCFDVVEKTLRRFLPEIQVTERWSGQVIEAVDGLPYIGEITEKQFIATGFSGNGLTFGTVAAMMACDAALGRVNPWKDLFDPRRKKLSALWNYIKENADYPYYMLKDRLAKSDGESIQSVKRGEGKILRLEKKRVAVYRDGKGQVTKLSPVCTHMGCIVNWNEAESTWDCPCHGSRFTSTGAVFAGPAETPLEKLKD